MTRENTCFLASYLQGGGSAYACTSPIDGSTACDAGEGIDVCQRSGFVWECDLDRSGGTSDAEAAVVLDDAADWCTLDAYCAFGTTASGNGFCCETGPLGATNRINLRGGNGDDVLAFQFDDGTNYHQLENVTSITVVAWMYGEDGADTMDGSPYWDPTTYRYDEVLDGGTWHDVIRGWGGEDGISGYTEDDVIRGGDDADYLVGGGGADRIIGGSGADIMFGETLQDQMNGSLGADTMYGGDQDDLMCGGDDAVGGDTLNGGNQDDQLWGGGVGDTENGDAATSVTPGDSCSYNGTTGTCETDINIAPTCPI